MSRYNEADWENGNDWAFGRYDVPDDSPSLRECERDEA